MNVRRVGFPITTSPPQTSSPNKQPIISRRYSKYFLYRSSSSRSDVKAQESQGLKADLEEFDASVSEAL